MDTGRPLTKAEFAEVMQHGMHEYEEPSVPRKAALFSHITPTSTVLDIGIGVGPNLRFLPKKANVIGLEPNHHMWSYCREKADALELKLSILDGRAENIPLSDGSVDAVICTLTLCSVDKPRDVICEIARVLRHGGTFSFIEHVLAGEDEPEMRKIQNNCNEEHCAMFDGCNLNRDTKSIIQGYTGVEGLFEVVRFERFNGPFTGPLRPHVEGILKRTHHAAGGN